jgi:anaerobic selenocysteine-containing dehydrogenase
MAGIDLATLRAKGPQRLRVGTPFAPFKEGGFFGQAGGKAKLAGHGGAPLYAPPREVAESHAPSSDGPLAFISPPAHHFLNSSFANLEFARGAEKGPELEIHPEDAALRKIESGHRVKVYNDRGAFEAVARVTESVKRGVVAAPSIWWLGATPTGRNANAVTSQALTDLGGGATFYDCAVFVQTIG